MQYKYYTPSIEDIRIGYFYEQNALLGINSDNSGLREWQSTQISNPVNLYDILIKIQKEPKTIRTPYLTKEQIESKGWNSDGIHFWKNEYSNTKLYVSNVIGEKHHIVIYRVTTGSKTPSILFTGYCPSINEFKYITEYLLKIKIENANTKENG